MVTENKTIDKKAIVDVIERQIRRDCESPLSATTRLGALLWDIQQGGFDAKPEPDMITCDLCGTQGECSKSYMVSGDPNRYFDTRVCFEIALLQDKTAALEKRVDRLEKLTRPKPPCCNYPGPLPDVCRNGCIGKTCTSYKEFEK